LICRFVRLKKEIDEIGGMDKLEEWVPQQAALVYR
jgi:hypothetical protein